MADIHSFESFGTVDGPGIRFVVFMQGCPLRCKYCHNPDSWNFGAGKEYTAEEVFKAAMKYKNYWGEKGGVTVTGGEPLSQIDFLTELFTLLKKQNVHTCIDTSGNPFDKENAELMGKFDKLMSVTDLVLLDIKEIDDEKHTNLTGKSNKNTLDFAKYLSEKGIKTWVRYVLVPGISDDRKDMEKLKEFIGTLSNVEKVEVLPYHTMGEAKYKKLGIPYPLSGVKPPDEESLKLAREILKIK